MSFIKGPINNMNHCRLKATIIENVWSLCINQVCSDVSKKIYACFIGLCSLKFILFQLGVQWREIIRMGTFCLCLNGNVGPCPNSCKSKAPKFFCTEEGGFYDERSTTMIIAIPNEKRNRVQFPFQNHHWDWIILIIKRQSSFSFPSIWSPALSSKSIVTFELLLCVILYVWAVTVSRTLLFIFINFNFIFMR